MTAGSLTHTTGWGPSGERRRSLEKAVPKNGCWTDYYPDNLKLYGNWNKKKYENADKEALRKGILMKCNYNKYYEAF